MGKRKCPPESGATVLAVKRKIGLPGCFVSDHRIEDGKEFTHRSSDGDLGSFTGSDQASVERANGWIVPDGNESGHIEYVAKAPATAGDTAPTLMATAIIVEWSNTDESSDVAAIQSSQLWQVGQHRMCGDRANAFETGKQVFFFT